MMLAVILPAPVMPVDGSSYVAYRIIEASSSELITRDQYRDFGGIRHTSNNATLQLEEGITFVADNRDLLKWYIHVTADLSGTIDVAYQIGPALFKNYRD